MQVSEEKQGTIRSTAGVSATSLMGKTWHLSLFLLYLFFFSPVYFFFFLLPPNSFLYILFIFTTSFLSFVLFFLSLSPGLEISCARFFLRLMGGK